MSANNYILIKWTKTRYVVSHRDADTNYQLDRIGEAVVLEDAVKLANDYTTKVQEEGSYIEYGLTIIPKPKVRRFKHK